VAAGLLPVRSNFRVCFGSHPQEDWNPMQNERTIPRELTYVVGGLALGLIVNKMIPLFASTSGALRARAGEDPFQKLIDDHRLIRTTLEEMEHAGDRSALYRGKLFLTLKTVLGKHATAEEDVVYPLVHDRANATEEAKHLYEEHADIKIHLYELENLLRANDDWTGVVRSLRQIVEGHIEDEEQVQFPRLRGILDQQNTRKLAGQIRREEALVG
jgi:hemerythrin superfamily protein